MARFLLAVGAVLVAAVAAIADDDDAQPGTLYPAPLPSPALKYRLLPDLRSQTPGDGLPLYFEAIAKFTPAQKAMFMERPDNPISKWAGTPLKELPRDEVRKALEPFKETLDLIDRAARCERCRGDKPLGTVNRGDGTFPEQYYLTEITDLLAVRARLQLADGDLNGALYTLQTGLAVARQIGGLPGLNYALVGPSIAESMLRQLEELVQLPKAPNLYWALADLPQPLIDQRKGVEADRLFLYKRFPGMAEAVADPNAGPLSAEQVQACVQVLLRYYRGQRLFQIQSEALLTRQLTDHYEEAKKALLAQGRPKDKVEAMPHVQVALLAAFANYDQAIDEQMLWYNEPYARIADQLERLEKKTYEPSFYKGLQPVVPTATSLELYRGRARLERRINLLRCIEAVRAYAAAHDGKLPASLDAIKDVPVPVDPVTGLAFVYKPAGDKATFETPEVPRASRRFFDDVTLDFVVITSIRKIRPRVDRRPTLASGAFRPTLAK